MKYPIEHIRLSQQARDQLIKLKRATKIEHWNVLCRWGFCASLAEPCPPANVKIPADSSVEMSWKIFGGPYQDLFVALLKQRCLLDNLPLDDDTLASQFRLHLHRGIGFISTDKSIKDLATFFQAKVIGLA